MRINTNVSALNTHRNVTNNSIAQTKSLEKLSSGMKINRGADAPAQLQISERLRAQTAGLTQAIDNSEMAVSLMQTGEAALDEVSRSLIQARQLAVHAANEGVNDQNMLRADQAEYDHIVESINRIAANTQYGHNYLLDGSGAGNGVTTGDNLSFVGSGTTGSSSGVGGYNIDISQAATRSTHTGTVALSQAVIDSGEQITITESGRTVNFKTTAGTTVEQTMNELSGAIKDAGLDVELVRPDPGTTDGKLPQNLTLRHKQFGSEHSFQVASNTAGILSNTANSAVTVQDGLDVEGEIGGEEATGRGQILTGEEGAGRAEGIQIRYDGEKAPAAGERAGTVTFMQNSLNFQIGGNARQTEQVSFKSMKAATLGNGVSNDSDFKSLNDVSMMNAAKAQDAIRIIDQAIEEVAQTRGDMGAFQKNTLESNLNFLRIAHENVVSSESVIRDADMAAEMTAFTRNQIMMDASTSMLAQANQKQMSVMKLLG